MIGEKSNRTLSVGYLRIGIYAIAYRILKSGYNTEHRLVNISDPWRRDKRQSRVSECEIERARPGVITWSIMVGAPLF